MKFLRRLNPARRGATAVEMAAVISVFVLLLFGILEYCLVLYATNVVENAAREGSRYAVVHVNDATVVADTQTVVKRFMGGLDKKMGNYTCNVYKSDSNGNNTGAAVNTQFGEYVCVQVSVVYVPMTPLLDKLKTFTIQTKCAMGSEAN
jgi:Flp pilus assembly protein TadG